MREDLGCQLRVIQLIGENAWKESATDYEFLRSKAGLAKIAEYADGIGPWKPMIVMPGSTRTQLKTSTLVQDAHAAKLLVHPYTFRLDPTRIPAYAKDFDDLLSIFLIKMKVDGVFTDFPDKAVSFVRRSEGKQ